MMELKAILQALRNREMTPDAAAKVLSASCQSVPEQSIDNGKEPLQSVVKLTEHGSGIVQITLEDRENKNSFSAGLISGLTDVFQTVAANPEWKAVILTGYDGYFATGGTKEGLLAIYEGKARFNDISVYSLALNCRIPVIVAMQGHAIGAGWSLGMFGDLIIMSRESIYCSNYMKYGFTPGAGATLIFPEKFGNSLAQEILFTGKRFSGAELEARGIPFPVLPREEVMSYALKWAREIAESPRESLIMLKEHMSAKLREKLADVIAKEAEMQDKTFLGQPDVKAKIESLYHGGANHKRKATESGEQPKETGSNPAKAEKQRAAGDAGLIAIIGMSGQFPRAENIEAFWRNLAEGKDCVTEVPEWRWPQARYYDSDPQAPGKTYSKWMGVLEEADCFDPLFFTISPAEAELMDPQQRLFLEHCWRCIEDAGINPKTLSGSRCGVFVGCGVNDYGQLNRKDSLNAQGLTGSAPSILAARISYLLNLKGPCIAMDTACSSSLVAIGEACNSLILGDSAMVLAGGVNVLPGPTMHVMTSKAGMLSQEGRCFTFDSRANGFVPGEGVGVLLLKRLGDAVRDRDPIRGVIRGWGINQDGRTNGITAPSANSQISLEKEVYRRYGINPETITLVEAHGTGTKLGDPIEVEALNESFKAYTGRRNYCALGSVKSNIGHLLTAAGVAGVIKVLEALRHRMLPPTIHFTTLNEHIALNDSPFYINTELRPWEASGQTRRRAAVSSFGFSGTNAHLVIEEYPAAEPESGGATFQETQIIALSAKTPEQLRTYAGRIREYLESREHISLRDLAYTLQVGREAMEERLALTAASLKELEEKLRDFWAGKEPIAGFYRGQVKTSQETLSILTADEAMTEPIEAGAGEGKYRKLAELWVKGLRIDWSQLYDGVTPQRVSLPTYPFARERYWIAAGAEAIHTIPVNMTPVSAESPSESEAFAENDLSLRLMDFLQMIFASVLKLSVAKLNVDTGFEEFGIDSLMVGQLNQSIEAHFGKIPSTLFFTYKNIRSLSEYFLERHFEKSRDLLESAAPKKMHTGGLANPRLEPAPANQITATEDEPLTDEIAIIGINGQYPEADNLEQYWENLTSGRDSIREIPGERWDFREYYQPEKGKYGGMYCYWGGFLEGVDRFDPSYFNISPVEARIMDPHERLFLQTVAGCLEDAGYTKKRLEEPQAGDRSASVGVFAGITYNNYQLYGAAEFGKGNYIPISSQIFSVANRVSYFFNLRGPSLAVDTACSSSLYAIHLACESIKRGECKMAIAGGVNLSLHPSKYMTLCSTQFASSDGRCRSFGEGGDGYVPGEAVGAVLLKPLSRAVRDRDRIYGVIKGTAVNHDGKTYGYSVPNPVAQTEVIKSALKKAKVNPRSISYIEAHGTGTSLGDPIEITGLTEAFGEFTHEKQFCAIGSVKSNIGHAEAAAGIAQLTKVILQFREKMLVPNLIHSKRLNPNIDFENTPFRVQRSLTKWDKPVIAGVAFPRRAGISSFGAGGVNVHLICEEYELPDRENSHRMGPELIVLSAQKRESLLRYAVKLKEYLSRMVAAEKMIPLADIAFTLQSRRENYPYRAAFLVETVTEVIDRLDQYLVTEREGTRHPEIFITKPEKGRAQSREFLTENTDKAIAAKDLGTLAQLWVDGAEINWRLLYDGRESAPVSLPTYCFMKERYWIGDISDATLSHLSQPVKTIEAPLLAGSRPISAFLRELIETPEFERYEMVERYLQYQLAELLGFNGSDLPDVERGFFDMGMESVAIARFQSVLETEFLVEIPDTAAFDYPNIKEFANYLLGKIEFDPYEYAIGSLPNAEAAIEGWKPDEKDKGDGLSDFLLMEEPLPQEIAGMSLEELHRVLHSELQRLT
jgi:acyl transferase domain-containing protein/enoyl-CoA hydratase/carnithine racemase/acyl carrier protein